MTGLPAIPDPAELATTDDPAARALAIVEPWSAALLTASDEMAEDAKAKAAAIEVYLRHVKAGVEGIGAAQTIQLRARMRLGELQPRQGGGRGLKASPRADGLAAERQQRHVNRLMSGHREEVERKLAELAPKGEATANALLGHLRRERRRNVDEGARSIVPPEVVESIEGDGWTLLGGRATEVLADWPDASVDLIVTDPPYPADELDRWTELGELAARLLVPQGVLVALTGQLLLPDVLDRIRSTGLRFGWIYCQLLPGGHSRIWHRNLAQSWKPWLVLTNGSWPAGINDRHEDVLPTSPAEKAGYAWRQSVGPARYLIDHLSPRGGVVLDPFTGTGTYGVAALAAGRRFVGVEADAGRLALAAQRLGEGAAA